MSEPRTPHVKEKCDRKDCLSGWHWVPATVDDLIALFDLEAMAEAMEGLFDPEFVLRAALGGSE